MKVLESNKIVNKRFKTYILYRNGKQDSKRTVSGSKRNETNCPDTTIHSKAIIIGRGTNCLSFGK